MWGERQDKQSDGHTTYTLRNERTIYSSKFVLSGEPTKVPQITRKVPKIKTEPKKFQIWDLETFLVQ